MYEVSKRCGVHLRKSWVRRLLFCAILFAVYSIHPNGAQILAVQTVHRHLLGVCKVRPTCFVKRRPFQYARGLTVRNRSFMPPSCRPNRETALNFFAAGVGEHEKFLPLFAVFALKNHHNSTVEIVVKSAEAFRVLYNAELNWLSRRFGEASYCVREFSKVNMQRTPYKNTWRFLEVPKLKAEYTYIGDVDILFTEDVLQSKRVLQMQHFQLPYSDVIRAGTKKLTGLLMVRTQEYFNDALLRAQKDTNAHGNDEEFLYRMISNSGHRLPSVDSRDYFAHYRPVHGLHLSLNRGLGMAMCHYTWVDNDDEQRHACEVLSSAELSDFLPTSRTSQNILEQYVMDVYFQIQQNASTHCEGDTCTCT